MCPPPRRMPLRREPARALPVPFCRYIFFVVPATSVRFFVRTVPRRRLFWYITTASWINCLLIRGAIWAGSISYLPTSAPVRSCIASVAMIFLPHSLPHAAISSDCAGFFVPGPDLVAHANHHVAADGTGHGAADQHQVVFRIEPGDQQIADGDVFHAVVAGHLVALEDVVRIGVHADRADVPVHLLHAVAWPADRRNYAASWRRSCRGPW